MAFHISCDKLDNISALIDKCLQRWPKSIDISDGELRSDDGFYSPNLSAAWHNAETEPNGTSDIDFMVWSIYGVLHKTARKKFMNQQYVVSIHELDVVDIKQDYMQEEKLRACQMDRQ